MTALGKFLLFFSSWFPAYAIIGLITLSKNPELGHWFFGLSAISVFIYFAMERMIFSRSTSSLAIASITRKDENVLMYVIAYLPPFFAVDLSSTGSVLAIALFYFLFSITYVKLNLYYLNPMFVLRSYRTYSIVAQSGEEYTALVRAPFKPAPGSTVHYRGRDQILIITGD